MFKSLTFCVLVCAGVYGSAIYWPEFFFKNKSERGNFVVVSRNGIPDSAGKFLERASYKISKSGLYSEEQKFEIYVAGSAGEYAFFAPFCRADYACLHPFKNIAFMSPADFEKGFVASVKDPLKTFRLENLMVREAVKLQIRARVQFLAYMALPGWKKEGYCEYVAASDDDEFRPSDICGENVQKDPGRFAYLNRLVVGYMLNEEKVSLTEILTTDMGPEAAIKTLKARYCNR